MVELQAQVSRFRLVTSTSGQLLWADRTAKVPLVKSAVAPVAIDALRTSAVRHILDRSRRENWPLYRAMAPGVVADLALKIASYIAAEMWVHVEDRFAVAGLNRIPIYACTWMPRGVVLIAPARQRVGVEWNLGDNNSLAVWAPEQVGVVG